MDDSEEITRLLRLAGEGDRAAEARLFHALYPDLRRMAGARLNQERGDHTLQPTALVNEAYLRLAGQTGNDWSSRAHFFAVAAQVMHRVLIDWARARAARKRGGGGLKRAELTDDSARVRCLSDVFLDLERALEKLQQQDPRAAQVVELRFFGGMTDEEIAPLINVCDRTVTRDWRFAKVWLQNALQKDGSDGGSWFRAAAGE
ncbi:MAG TPA: ECF-type sigma factor [Bryobacteraceae bacterium]|nr:ECF-type sigma factor [Bryobacteraceae bacterium]